MKLMIWATVVAATLFTCAESSAKTAKDILEAAWEMQVSRWDGLDSYLVEQTVMGQASKQYFVRTLVTDSVGGERVMFLPAPTIGSKPGCVNPVSPGEAAAGKGDASSEYMSWFIDQAKLVGEDSVGDQAALQFRAEGIDQLQSMGDQEVTMKAMNIWLSKGEYLPLKVRMEGVATIDGEARPVEIDTLNSDFRTVSGSHLNEPFRRTVNISGMFDSADSAQVAKAQKQIAEFEKQMAGMPASQREMMEKMMGPRLESMRRMNQTGGLETEILVTSITANPEVAGERVVACDKRSTAGS